MCVNVVSLFFSLKLKLHLQSQRIVWRGITQTDQPSRIIFDCLLITHGQLAKYCRGKTVIFRV